MMVTLVVSPGAPLISIRGKCRSISLNQIPGSSRVKYRLPASGPLMDTTGVAPTHIGIDAEAAKHLINHRLFKMVQLHDMDIRRGMTEQQDSLPSRNQRSSGNAARAIPIGIAIPNP